MTDGCINLSKNAIGDLKSTITNYNIGTLLDDDASLVVKRLNFSFKCLEIDKSVTNDLVKSLFTVIQTS